MIFTYMILTALIPTAKGLMGCNVSEPMKAQQCVGALGEPLIFNLPTTAASISLKKDQTGILNIGNNKVNILDKEHQGLFEFVSNGALKLNKAMKKHSGDYMWEGFDSKGTKSYTIHMHLQIQAPVSEPAVSQTCLSPEQMEVSCSSEGDEVQFILSLDGHLLMKTRTHVQSQRNWKGDTQISTGTTHKQDRAHISNVSISLSGQLTGNLTCHVWNNVSRDEKVIHLKSCKDSVSCFPVVTVAVITSVVLLLHVALCVLSTQDNKTHDH